MDTATPPDLFYNNFLAAGSFSVTILGSSAALPANNRNPTSQLLKADQSYYLIDCGEGTQSQMRRYHVKMQRIKVVFISHLHGDHYFGLLGLLNSMHLLGRQAPITIVCPKMLKEIIELQTLAGGGKLQFTINYEFTDEVKGGDCPSVFEDSKIQVSAFRLKHRIPCCGFIFKQQEKPLTFDAQASKEYKVPIRQIPAIKAGADFIDENGNRVKNELLTHPSERPRTYAFCTDTLAREETIEHVRNVDCLYHETTFVGSETERAKATYHSTTYEAAEIARKAEVGQLIIGHFSARYPDLEVLRREASELFPNTLLAIEGTEIFI